MLEDQRFIISRDIPIEVGGLFILVALVGIGFAIWGYRTGGPRGEQILRRGEEVAAHIGYPVRSALVQARDAGQAIVEEARDRGVDCIVLDLGLPYQLPRRKIEDPQVPLPGTPLDGGHPNAGTVYLHSLHVFQP